jgi:hypothetical protein
MEFILAVFFIAAIKVMLLIHAKKSNKDEKAPASVSAAANADAVDMTPPALQANDQPVRTQISINSKEPKLDLAVLEEFNFDVPAEARISKQAKAVTPFTSFGNEWFTVKGVRRNPVGQPQAVRVTSPARVAAAARLSAQKLEEARKANKADKRRAKDFQARLKAFREGLLSEPAMPDPEEMLEQHLRMGGVLS